MCRSACHSLRPPANCQGLGLLNRISTTPNYNKLRWLDITQEFCYTGCIDLVLTAHIGYEFPGLMTLVLQGTVIPSYFKIKKRLFLCVAKPGR